jgi:hypothetical protein
MIVQSTKAYGVDRLKFLIYAPPGNGKTRLAATIGEPTLVVSAEAGLLSLKDFEIDVADITIDDKGQLLPKEKRIDRLVEIYNFLTTPIAQAKYKWIFLDSLSEVGQNLVEKLKEKYPKKSDALPMWGEYSDTMRALIKAFRDLPYYNVVMTALPEKTEQEGGEVLTRIGLSGKIGQQVPAYFDEVFYLSLTKDSEQRQLRRLITSGHEGLVCKDRSGMLAQYEEPNLQMIANKIKGEK